MRFKSRSDGQIAPVRTHLPGESLVEWRSKHHDR